MKLIQEYVSLTRENPFLVSIFDHPDLSYPFHHHKDAYELTLTLGLSGTRMIGDHTEQFMDNDLVLMAPGLPHCWQDHGLRGKARHRVIVIQFSDALIPTSSLSTDHFKAIARALDRSKYGLELRGDIKGEAIKLIQGMQEDKGLENYLGILKVLELFSLEGATRQLCSEGYLNPSTRDESGRLEKVLLYIQENYTRKLSIREVADQANMSPSAFSHYFKKRTRKSYTDFVMDMRLGRAAQLLQLEEMPVSCVGYESGFMNISHFNRSFSRKYGIPPLKFRKQSMQILAPDKE